MPLSLTGALPALAALLAVLALVLLAARAARLTGLARPATGSRLVLQDTLTIDRARRIHIVRCDGQEVLLLTGGSADLLVGWLPKDGVQS